MILQHPLSDKRRQACPRLGRSYFLLGSCLLGKACCFACEALLALTCFCADFF
jgi:hypothetical protein